MPYAITWEFPTFKEGNSRSFSIFQDTSVGQARGWETSAASSNVSSWLSGILPCWWNWKLFCSVQSGKGIFINTQNVCSGLTVQALFTECSAQQELVAQQMPLWTYCWSVPNPCLPPILTKLTLEFLMALAVVFPHCWNVRPLFKEQSLTRLSSDCPVVLCFPPLSSLCFIPL